jgi:hypothetical protein
MCSSDGDSVKDLLARRPASAGVPHIGKTPIVDLVACNCRCTWTSANAVSPLEVQHLPEHDS